MEKKGRDTEREVERKTEKVENMVIERKGKGRKKSMKRKRNKKE